MLVATPLIVISQLLRTYRACIDLDRIPVTIKQLRMHEAYINDNANLRNPNMAKICLLHVLDISKGGQMTNNSDFHVLL